jgi:DNA invertase Pin-like site-specific DNA recombinase
MSYYIYCRKSSESEERQVLSIESQAKELQELAERLNLPISAALTESYSAKYPGRPIFNSMMNTAYKGKIKGIIAWKLDRLARNPLDGSALVWALDRGKITEIVTPHGTFHNNSNDKLMMQIEFGMAKKYVDDLSDNVKRGNRAKLEKGWMPGLPPLGYLNEPIERTIVVDPDRFSTVRKMWDLLFQGIPLARILEMVNNKWGFRTRIHKKTGGMPLSLSGLYRIFGNPFYYGLIQRNEGMFAGRHTPMITEDEYWMAQSILGRKGRPKPKKHDFPFTGLIKCGECGCMITAEEKIKKSGKCYVYYHCTKKKKSAKCRQQFLNAHDLEKQILAFLSRIHFSKDILALTLEYIEKEQKEDAGTRFVIEKSIKQAISQCQKKLENLNKMRIGNLIDDEEYLKEKKALQQEKIGLEMRLHNNEDPSLKLTIDTLNFAGSAMERFQKDSSADKRAVFREIGSNFSLKDRKLSIEAEKPLVIVEEGLKKINGDFGRLEPSNFPLTTPKNGLSVAQIHTLSASVEDVRTFFRKKYIAGISKQNA